MLGNFYESLRGRGVLVSGGADGIGAAIVEGFARAGSRVAFLDINEQKAASLIDKLDDCEHRPHFIHCDVTDLGQLERSVEVAAQAIGPILTLVNNAANDTRQKFEEITEESFERTIALNLRHHVFAAKWVTPFMKANGSGAIVNMSSLAWMRGTFDVQIYATAKAGVVGFTNSMARQFGPFGIRVNAIAPGLVLTERQLALWWHDPADREKNLERSCLKRHVYPEDVARLALFLGSDESSMITKQCVVINGGSL